MIKTETIEEVETHTVKIYCPECGRVETITKDGPAHPEHMPNTSSAFYDADDTVRRHCGSVEAFRGETHHPIVFTESGAQRFEPEVSEFVN